ncbi:MAG: hypothetical protein UT66_C0035G0017 [candidate division CPR2 bacterium GW2011_GWC1_39_9]|uniref:Uncharacterized protein n=1 Tax=candidate division CPR2 bacterium GW2011_GWC2_39_10 TaxID=1618345 RepID=A0A0G0P6H8_UNCC2|nr:MAG: hypothetical protein UT18_C0016G0010 [candidate division CPR2 bacterium GW2011_GWC2_39_10]KKR33684.1 MAG: hypothetical protein UT66_C0035G0017 [candidate division CPR2 bacterium GW2011_GWC1_39_9]
MGQNSIVRLREVLRLATEREYMKEMVKSIIRILAQDQKVELTEDEVEKGSNQIMFNMIEHAYEKFNLDAEAKVDMTPEDMAKQIVGNYHHIGGSGDNAEMIET